jgi:beta-lactam-binding protein with PASTA domain
MGVEDSSAARVTVPLLIAMTVREARSAGHKSGVVVTSADADGPPLGARTWPGIWVVTAQRPAAGSQVPRWSTVVIEWAKLRKA